MKYARQATSDLGLGAAQQGWISLLGRGFSNGPTPAALTSVANEVGQLLAAMGARGVQVQPRLGSLPFAPSARPNAKQQQQQKFSYAGQKRKMDVRARWAGAIVPDVACTLMCLNGVLGVGEKGSALRVGVVVIPDSALLQSGVEGKARQLKLVRRKERQRILEGEGSVKGSAGQEKGSAGEKVVAQGGRSGVEHESPALKVTAGVELACSLLAAVGWDAVALVGVREWQELGGASESRNPTHRVREMNGLRRALLTSRIFK